jgi:preprotein translocase subunit SecB
MGELIMTKMRKMSLVTNKVEVTNNFLPNGQFNLNPSMTLRTGKISENVFFNELNLEIKDKEEERFPINLFVSLKGIFEFEEIESEVEVFDFLKLQGVQMVFPYLRAMVSSITSSSMFAPVILPIIDVSQFFKDKN